MRLEIGIAPKNENIRECSCYKFARMYIQATDWKCQAEIVWERIEFVI